MQMSFGLDQLADPDPAGPEIAAGNIGVPVVHTGELLDWVIGGPVADQG
jgi:hypothetical protein